MAQDTLYDPENRQAQRNFVRGQPRTDPMAIADLIGIWRCHRSEHGECWSSSHLSTREVGIETLRCAPTCGCWRHTILAYARDRRLEH